MSQSWQVLLVALMQVTVVAQAATTSTFASWTCVLNGDGAVTPARYDGLNIQCMSTDGRGCLWVYGPAKFTACQALISAPPAGLNPLSCGAAHQAIYGGPGYGLAGHWCQVGLDTIAPKTVWTCLNGLNAPVRYDGINIECMSTNGRDCLWQASNAACLALAASPPAGLNPLTCGAVHQAIHGAPGYGVAAHWCQIGQNMLAPKASWTCMTGWTIAVRYDGINIQCMSTDGRNCLAGADNAACLAMAATPPASLMPLTCGAAHQAVWGIPGYGDAPHWCQVGLNTLAPRALPSSPSFASWTCIVNGDGAATPARYDGLNIQCMSTDGRGCLWVYGPAKFTACQALISAPPAGLNPLSCGAAHQAIYGGPGYGLAGHWCQVGLDTIAPKTVWTCLNGLNAPVRYDGINIECMATNGRDCLWQASNAACLALAASPPAGLNPLTCGAVHQAIHGAPGYGVATHWCQIGQNMLAPKASWTCMTGWTIPIRYDGINVQCMSMDGRNCLGRADTAGCLALAAAPPAGLMPLTCGAASQAVWGIPGYGDATHWCQIGLNTLAPKVTPLASNRRTAGLIADVTSMDSGMSPLARGSLWAMIGCIAAAVVAAAVLAVHAQRHAQPADCITLDLEELESSA